jgi:hypothetical protein
MIEMMKHDRDGDLVVVDVKKAEEYGEPRPVSLSICRYVVGVGRKCDAVGDARRHRPRRVSAG